MTGLFFAGIGASANANASSNVNVKSGDTLWDISQKYNTSVDELANTNHLNANDVLQVGQSLNIPNGQNNQSNNTSAGQNNTNSQASQPEYHSNIQTTSEPQTSTPQTNNQNNNTQSTSDDAAKEWIASHESSGSYSASNGQYYGRYQVSTASLNGDYSSANQDKVANQYVQSRYGSWSNAKNFWQANGWY